MLPYKNVAGVNPPEKIATEPPIQAMSAARLQSEDDLRSISGVYDATQQPEAEESGKAILARRRQTSTGNAHYLKALARGIKRTAQILMKLFPVIYDTARVMRISGADMQPKQVVVHAGQPESVPPMIPAGVKGVFDLTVGTYDVEVSVGASYETKRQESVDMLLTLCQANPAIVPIIGDLVVQEMDFSGKKAIVQRLQRALPPQLQDQQNPTDPNQLAAHNAQLMQQNQALMQQVQHITQILQTKQVENQGRLQVEGLKLQSAQVRADAAVEAARLKEQSSILRDAAGNQFDAVHEHAMATRDAVQGVIAAHHAAAIAPPPVAPKASE